MSDDTLYIFSRFIYLFIFFYSSAIPSSFTTLRIIVKSTAFINVYLKCYSIFNVTLYSTIALCKIYIVHVPRILSPFFRLSPIYIDHIDREILFDKLYPSRPMINNTSSRYCQKLFTFIYTPIPNFIIIIIVRNYSSSPFS